MKNFGEMLIGKKPSKKQENREEKKAIISTNEEKDRPGLGLDQQDQTIIKEHLDLTDAGFEDTPSKEKKFISTEEASDNFDWETYILDSIDATSESEEDKDEIKTPASIHRPAFINNIIRKYSLPNEEWKRLTPMQREQRKQDAQKEIQELYIRQPKKMVRKDKKENTEIAA
jgi:hypothetical protein